MARTYIEDSAFVITKQMAKEMGVSRNEVLGLMARLWRDSQAAKQDKCTLDDICIWLDIDVANAEKLVLSGIKKGFFSKNKKNKLGKITINGNKKHIQKLRELKTSAEKGGKARRAKAQQKPRQDAKPNASSESQNKNEANALSSAVQCSSVQCSSVQYSSNNKRAHTEKIEIGIPQNVKNEWEQTCSHYGVTPKISDEVPLFQSFQLIKDWSRVKTAIIGFRYEQASGDYDPKTQFNIYRLTDKKKFTRLESLGEIRPDGKPKSKNRWAEADALAEAQKNVCV